MPQMRSYVRGARPVEMTMYMIDVRQNNATGFGICGQRARNALRMMKGNGYKRRRLAQAQLPCRI
jgi:hypothetical protein